MNQKDSHHLAHLAQIPLLSPKAKALWRGLPAHSTPVLVEVAWNFIIFLVSEGWVLSSDSCSEMMNFEVLSIKYVSFYWIENWSISTSIALSACKCDKFTSSRLGTSESDLVKAESTSLVHSLWWVLLLRIRLFRRR